MPTNARTADGLENLVTGLGQSNSKRAHNRFTFDSLIGDYAHLEAAYLTDWIAEAIVDLPAEDALRPWRTIKDERAPDVQAYEKKAGLESAIILARKWARLYGGAGIIMVTDQDLQKPLNPGRIRPGSLKRLLPFDRYDLAAHTLNTWDVLAENYLLPEFYTVRNGSTLIHHTHVARFTGMSLPRKHAMQLHGWGDSALRKPLEIIADLVASIGGIAELMQEANVDVLKRAGLDEDLASDQEEFILKRYQLFSSAKSIVNMALLDKENEEYDRATLNLTGVAPIIEQFMIMVAAAAGLPFVKLFGTSAKGLNATGEGDNTTYYDRLASDRKHYIEPGLRVIDRVLGPSAGADPDFEYEWNPFYQPSDKEQADTAFTRAQTHRIYLEDGVIDAEQVREDLSQRDEYDFEDFELEQRDAY